MSNLKSVKVACPCGHRFRFQTETPQGFRCGCSQCGRSLKIGNPPRRKKRPDEKRIPVAQRVLQNELPNEFPGELPPAPMFPDSPQQGFPSGNNLPGMSKPGIPKPKLKSNSKGGKSAKSRVQRRAKRKQRAINFQEGLAFAFICIVIGALAIFGLTDQMPQLLRNFSPPDVSQLTLMSGIPVVTSDTSGQNDEDGWFVYIMLDEMEIECDARKLNDAAYEGIRAAGQHRTPIEIGFYEFRNDIDTEYPKIWQVKSGNNMLMSVAEVGKSHMRQSAWDIFMTGGLMFLGLIVMPYAFYRLIKDRNSDNR